MKNPHLPITITRRNLPHWTQAGAIYWTTFRLADSLPSKKLKTWKLERDIWLKLNPTPWNHQTWKIYHRRFGNRLEDWLDAGYGECILKDSKLRTIISDVFLRFHGERHRIHHGVIMPNHAHLLLEPFKNETLSYILKGMKGCSARMANLQLGTSGTFWMDESYDHIVQSEAQYHHFINYILDNPIKAHLQKHEYTFLNP